MSARNTLLFWIALYAKQCEEREGSGHLYLGILESLNQEEVLEEILVTLTEKAGHG